MLKLSRVSIENLLINGSYIIIDYGILYYKINYLDNFRFNITVSKNMSIFSSKRNRIKRQINEFFRLNSFKFLNFDLFFIVNYDIIFNKKKIYYF